jgi:hypothetical protein
MVRQRERGVDALDVTAVKGEGPRWYRPDVDRFWEWSLFFVFAITFCFLVFFTILFLVTGESVWNARFLMGEVLISIVVVLFLAWFLMERDENRLKDASYKLDLKARPDQVIGWAMEVLGAHDLPFSQGYGLKVKPLYSRINKVNVFSYDVDLARYMILIEHRKSKGTSMEEDVTSLRIGPSNETNHPRVLQFIETFNALIDEGRGPELVVWTEGSRRPPANAGEGFNSSGTVTSDDEEEAI